MRINEIIDNNSNPIDEDWNDEVNANYIKYRETNPYYNPNQILTKDDPLMGPWDKAGMTKAGLRAAQEKIIGKNEKGLAAYDAALNQEIEGYLTGTPEQQEEVKRRAAKRAAKWAKEDEWTNHTAEIREKDWTVDQWKAWKKEDDRLKKQLYPKAVGPMSPLERKRMNNELAPQVQKLKDLQGN